MNASNINNIKWYVVQTKPNCESNVVVHLQNADLRVFFPRIRSCMKSFGKSVIRLKPLFPAYVFLHMDLENPDSYRKIKYTRGVRKILGNGIEPIPIPEEAIEIIRTRADGLGIIEQRITFKKGDGVRIKNGFFKDLMGILEKPVSASGRVKVLMNIMNQQIRFSMSVADIEKIELG